MSKYITLVEGDLVCNIPKGMTNGEVITAIFPNMIESAWEHKKYLTDICGDYSAIEYTDEWWSAPYKAESEEKSE